MSSNFATLPLNKERPALTGNLANYPGQPAGREDLLETLQRDAFGYFLHETKPSNGLVADMQTDSRASVAAIGFAL